MFVSAVFELLLITKSIPLILFRTSFLFSNLKKGFPGALFINLSSVTDAMRKSTFLLASFM